MIAGLLLGALASALFNIAVVLQAAQAREISSAHGLRLSLLRRLLERPRWVAGMAVSVAGTGLQILALTLAPLTVVQPANAAGLVLLVVIASRTLHESVGRRELIAVIGIVLGITAIVAIEPVQSSEHRNMAGLSIALFVLASVTAAPYILHRRGITHDRLVVVAAGFGFAAVAFSMKLAALSLASRAWVSLSLAAAVAATAGLAGTLSEQTALQRRPAAQVAPIIFVTELVVPLVLALTIGGEHWPTTEPGLAVICGGLALLVAGVVSLARLPALSELLSDAGAGVAADQSLSLPQAGAAPSTHTAAKGSSNGLSIPRAPYAGATTASASTSTSIRGSISAATCTIVMHGRRSPKNSAWARPTSSAREMSVT